MRDSIKTYIPTDTNVNASNYQIPNFENQKDLLVAMLAPSGNEDENAAPQPQSHHNQPKDARDKKMEELHLDWIDVMSFSHNVAKAESKKNRTSNPHIGEITLTKFTCDRSPSLNYSALRGELIPHIIHRVMGKLKDNELPIIEYELHYCSLENVSISGGTGGKPVETLSVSSKIIIIKNIKLNIVTGELSCYQVCKWDKLKGTGSKTIRPVGNGATSTGASLFELAKQRLIVDLDSHDPATVKLLKELGIVSDYELPESENPESSEEFYRVMTNKDPALFQLIDVPSGLLTVEIIKKSISDKLNIPLDTIKSLYNYTNGILVDSQKMLNLSNSFIVQTTDGKFYGH